MRAAPTSREIESSGRGEGQKRLGGVKGAVGG